MKAVVSVALLLLTSNIWGQNLDYVKTVVEVLASEEYHGRGYVNNGGKKAANFIKAEFEKADLEQVQFQDFTHAVNTFPGALSVNIDGKELKPGLDYQVEPSSKGCSNLKLELVYLEAKHLKSFRKFKRFIKKHDWSQSALVYSNSVIVNINNDAVGRAFANNELGAAAYVHLEEAEKLTWSVRDRVKNRVWVEVLKSSWPANAKSIRLNIEQELITSFQNQNVLGFLPGKNTDSTIVFTAHYDHLGRMGTEACFYGTNDNAGGAAMLLDLAKFYAKNDSLRKYNMLFIAFAGEEAGLVGSKYFVEHPIYPLEQISLLINLDLVTNGQDGMTVVNGRVFKGVMRTLKSINTDKEYMAAIKGRGKAANSDHYYFSENGVRSIFIYLLGEYPYYHDINDTPDKPSWAGYNNFFRLIVDLCENWSN
ncbi:MAG: Zn-dependent exopeptidase M28 [Bacteroidia bacterium]